MPNFFTASIRRWVLACFEHFGTGRALFASNWPMDNHFTIYPRLLVSFRKLTEQLTMAQRGAVFATNAERVYRI